MTRTALIGHTGFVGSHLKAQGRWTDYYQSKNIDEIKGKSYDQVICSGISAVKWWANQHPTEDWLNIQRLLEVLRTIQTKQFILISTVDVYPQPNQVDEHTSIAGLSNHPYGLHRFNVEVFVQEQFPNSLICRLPGLFGHGLKKNVLFDLLTGNCLDAIHPQSKFQYYFLNRLTSDIQRALEYKIKLLNVTTMPIATEEILHPFFPHLKVGQTAKNYSHYDVLSAYSHQWGRTDGYLYGKEEVLRDLSEFIQTYRISIQS